MIPTTQPLLVRFVGYDSNLDPRDISTATFLVMATTERFHILWWQANQDLFDRFFNVQSLGLGSGGFVNKLPWNAAVHKIILPRS